LLSRARVRDLGLHPVAVHARIGQNEQQLVVDADSFVDLLADLPAGLDIVRSEPAADTTGLQVGVDTVGELLVFGRIADEARVELQGRAGQRLHKGNEVVGNACTAQERLEDLTLWLCVDFSRSG
jgi:hypothetical protein